MNRYLFVKKNYFYSLFLIIFCLVNFSLFDFPVQNSEKMLNFQIKKKFVTSW